MKTAPLTAADLAASVVAVPPLCRHADLTLNREQNVQLIRHLEGGGMRVLLYGGNANLYNIGLYEYAELLDFLAEAAGDDTHVIPSVGPDFGKMMDQSRVLADRDFPTAMILPAVFGATPAGFETGVRRFVEAVGRPCVLYIKHVGLVEPDGVRRLFDDGLVSVIKYAIVRPPEQLLEDPFLRALADAVDPRRIISGMGEQPAVVHLRDFGLGGFTTGCGCVAPRASNDLLQAAHRGDWDRAERLRAAFKPLEEIRDRVSPIRVLHEAVALAGVARTGPILPLLSNLDPADHPAVRDAARAVLALDAGAPAG